MDHRDETCRRMEAIYDQLHSSYCQFNDDDSPTPSECFSYPSDREHVQSLRTPKDLETGLHVFNVGILLLYLKLMI